MGAKNGNKTKYKGVELDSGAEAMLAEYLDTTKGIKLTQLRPEGFEIISDIESPRTDDEKLDTLLSEVAYDVKSARRSKSKAIYTPDFIIEVNGKEYVVECKNKYEVTHDKAYILRRKLFLQRYPEKRLIEFVYMGRSKGFVAHKYF